MAEFGMSFTTSYQPVIVIIALSCRPTIFELFDVEEYRDREIYSQGSLTDIRNAPFEIV